MNRSLRIFVTSACSAIVLLVGIRTSHAAILSVSPDAQTVAPGDTVSVDVRLNSEKQVVNAVQVRLLYDPRALTVRQVSKGDSALTLWTEEPTVDAQAGVIAFSGGIPNGSYVIDGRLASITFLASSIGSSSIRLDSGTSGVYLNDGQGTKASLTVTSGSVDVQVLPTSVVISSPSHPDPSAWYPKSIVQVQWTASPGAQYAYIFTPDRTALPDTRVGLTEHEALFGNVRDGTYYFILQEHLPNDQWAPPVRFQVNVDTTRPAPFTPQLTRDVIPGKLVLVFTTTDPTSSIARWRVQEGNQVVEDARSPYVLADQRNRSPITVTAFDEAGNTQVSTLAATSASPQRSLGTVYLVAGGLVMLLLLGLLLRHHRRHRKS